MANNKPPRHLKRLVDRPNQIEEKIPDLSDFVSIDDSVTFIVRRIAGTQEERNEAGKIRKRLRYAIGKKEICEGDKIKFEELIKFVLSKKEWSDKFADFQTAEANISIPTLTVSAFGSTQPNSFNDCLQENRELKRKIIDLQKKIIELMKEIERLQLYEQKHKKHIEDSRRGGLKGKGSKKNY